MGRTSPRALYNAAIRHMAAKYKPLTLQDTAATQLIAEIFDVKPLAVSRHVWLVRNGRVTEQRSFPLPKALTPPGPRKPRWIG